MALRRTRIFIQVTICISLLLVFWNIFWVSRLDQAQVTLKTATTTHSFISSDGNSAEILNTLTKVDDVQHVRPQDIRIAAVVCGNRVNETVVMMKSAIFTSSSPVRFIIFADNLATKSLNKTVSQWPEKILKRMQLDLRPITFPSDKVEEWKKLFKPCASQRLFLPVSLLPFHLLLSLF